MRPYANTARGICILQLNWRVWKDCGPGVMVMGVSCQCVIEESFITKL